MLLVNTQVNLNISLSLSPHVSRRQIIRCTRITLPFVWRHLSRAFENHVEGLNRKWNSFQMNLFLREPLLISSSNRSKWYSEHLICFTYDLIKRGRESVSRGINHCIMSVDIFCRHALSLSSSSFSFSRKFEGKGFSIHLIDIFRSIFSLVFLSVITHDMEQCTLFPSHRRSHHAE